MTTPEMDTGLYGREGIGADHSSIINEAIQGQVGNVMDSGDPLELAIAPSIITEAGERIDMENSKIFFVIKKNKELQGHDIEGVLIDFWGFCDSKTLLSKNGIDLNGVNKDWIVKWKSKEEFHLKDNTGEKTILVLKISPDREAIHIINESNNELYTRILYAYMDHINLQLK